MASRWMASMMLKGKTRGFTNINSIGEVMEYNHGNRETPTQFKKIGTPPKGGRVVVRCEPCANYKNETAELLAAHKVMLAARGKTDSKTRATRSYVAKAQTARPRHADH